MLSKNSVIYRFLCISWVLITMVPRKIGLYPFRFLFSPTPIFFVFCFCSIVFCALSVVFRPVMLVVLLKKSTCRTFYAKKKRRLWYAMLF